MRNLRAVFIVGIFAVSQAVLSKAQSGEIAFTHVAVVDVLNGQIEPDMTMLISGQKIEEVGLSKVVHVPKHRRSPQISHPRASPGFGTCTFTAYGTPSGLLRSSPCFSQTE
jgi:hypothetical protein